MNSGKDWWISRETASSTELHPTKLSRTNSQRQSTTKSPEQIHQRPIRTTIRRRDYRA